jgi:hypothetical protein
MKMNYSKLGPICRTTVLRPTAPRTAPNPPGAAAQQPQGQAPGAGGITEQKKTIL